MAFGDNIKSERKKLGITQEQLAEMINVSRQAISKWESNQGYPETEKLILLSKKLNVSIDYLMSNEIPKEKLDENKSMPLNKIAIMSFDKKTLVMCQSVKASKVFGENKFQYILLGVKKTTFLGDSTEILGWYETSEDIEKEISEINDAIKHGNNQYDLKYFADVKLEGIFGQPVKVGTTKKESKLKKHIKNHKLEIICMMTGAGIGGLIGLYLYNVGLI